MDLALHVADFSWPVDPRELAPTLAAVAVPPTTPASRRSP